MSIDEHTSVTGEPDPIASAEHRIAETRDHHIVITDLTERAYAHAKRNEGPLAGYTLAVKDNIDVSDVRTTQGSLLYGGERALGSAPVVTALEAAGTATVAKVNLHEFAYGVSSGNAHFGAVRNPVHPAHTSGGSSGGSAAAVATGIARVALGTDTGGSVRIPAACVGVVGLRPRHGLLDPTGVFALAPSFDTVGPIAATVDDVERVWKALLAGAAVDGRGTSVARGTHFGPGEPRADDRRSALADSDQPTDVCVGVVDDADAAALTRLGVHTEPFAIDVAMIQRHFSTGFRAEVSRTHAGTFPALAESYDPNVATKLADTRGITPTQYDAAMDALAQQRGAVLDAMDTAGLDAFITRTLGGAVPRADTDELTYRDELTWYVGAFSALNLPALAIGNLQIVGRTESDVLAIGRALETAGLTATAAPLS